MGLEQAPEQLLEDCALEQRYFGMLWWQEQSPGVYLSSPAHEAGFLLAAGASQPGLAQAQAPRPPGRPSKGHAPVEGDKELRVRSLNTANVTQGSLLGTCFLHLPGFSLLLSARGESITEGENSLYSPRRWVSLGPESVPG